MIILIVLIFSSCMLMIILIVLIFSSCMSESEKQQKKLQAFSDSLKIALQVDSIMKVDEKNWNFDTIGVANGPVQIILAKPVQREYSTYKNVFLKYKNVSDKDIEGIKFKWYGETVFGDPADLGGYPEGFGGGYTDDLLKKGNTSSGTWDALSRNCKKIILAWPTEVVFTDGTKWKSK